MTGVIVREGFSVSNAEFKRNLWQIKGHYDDMCLATIEISKTKIKCLGRKFVDGIVQKSTILSIKHPNIVEIYGEARVKKMGTSLLLTEYSDYFLSEFLETGKLKQYDRSKEIALIYRWSIHASSAIQHLHNFGICHGLITPRAFVITPGFDLKLFEMPFQTSQQAVLISDNYYAIWCPHHLEQNNMFTGMLYDKGYEIDIDRIGLLIWQLVSSDTLLTKDILVPPGPDLSNNYWPVIPRDCPKLLASVINSCWLPFQGYFSNINVLVLTLKSGSIPPYTMHLEQDEDVYLRPLQQDADVYLDHDLFQQDLYTENCSQGNVGNNGA